jgi:Stress responsive A/B Barrel Domain
MIKHVVLFKFKQGTAQTNVDELMGLLAALPDAIPEIKSYQFGRDVTGIEKPYDFALVSGFDDMAALKQYADHPDHVKVVEFVRTISDDVASVDFEV